MKLLLTFAFAALASGCGAQWGAAKAEKDVAVKEASTVRPIGPRGRAEVPAGCSLRVDFGSYAMGIDRNAAQAVQVLLASDPGVVSVEAYPWGREGESTTCVFTRTEPDAERLLHAVGKLFPADPRGPLTVSTRTGLRRSAGRP